MGKVKEIFDSIHQALQDYVVNTDEAKARRDAHKALSSETEPTPTWWEERQKRMKDKEPLGSAGAHYE